LSPEIGVLKFLIEEDSYDRCPIHCRLSGRLNVSDGLCCKQWRSWLPKWKAAYRWAVERDFPFHIYDESRIRGQWLANIKTLSRFLDKQSDDPLAGLIADFVGDGMVSMGDILSHFSTFPACGSEVYRMLANRGLFFDLEGPLSADTLIWRKND